MNAGTEYTGGTLTAPIVYVSDGVERWATRGNLRWRRPCYCAEEYAALLAALVGVPDTSEGWDVVAQPG